MQRGSRLHTTSLLDALSSLKGEMAEERVGVFMCSDNGNEPIAAIPGAEPLYVRSSIAIILIAMLRAASFRTIL